MITIIILTIGSYVGSKVASIKGSYKSERLHIKHRIME